MKGFVKYLALVMLCSLIGCTIPNNVLWDEHTYCLSSRNDIRRVTFSSLEKELSLEVSIRKKEVCLSQPLFTYTDSVTFLGGTKKIGMNKSILELLDTGVTYSIKVYSGFHQPPYEIKWKYK